jgi:hypothetical protein
MRDSITSRWSRRPTASARASLPLPGDSLRALGTEDLVPGKAADGDRDPVSRPGLRRIQSGVGQAAHGSPESREVAPATDPGVPDVYLVPGTWAPGILRTIFARGLPPPPGWTTVGSPFVEGARLSFPGSAVFRVIWGGRNLASDRSSGAAALYAAVKQDSKRLKFIISHSHGGGLALKSLSAGASSPRSTWRSVIALSSGGRRAAYPRSRMGLSKACRACRELLRQGAEVRIAQRLTRSAPCARARSSPASCVGQHRIATANGSARNAHRPAPRVVAGGKEVF